MDRSAAVVDTVDDAVKAARDSLRGGRKRLAKTTRQAAAQTERLVQSNYWSAIGIAAAAGAAIAALLSLRMHR